MIEEIKKEYEELKTWCCPEEFSDEEEVNGYYKMIGRRECLKEILDKYQDKKENYENKLIELNDIHFKYKELWEDLKNQPTRYITKYLDKLGFVETKTLKELLKELEQKYNLGGE